MGGDAYPQILHVSENLAKMTEKRERERERERDNVCSWRITLKLWETRKGNEQ